MIVKSVLFGPKQSIDRHINILIGLNGKGLFQSPWKQMF